MKIEQAKVMALGNRVSGARGHRYITVELEHLIDMPTLGNLLNLVPAADWVSQDLANSINGRFMEFDISQQIQNGGLEALQSVYIDNGPNNCNFTLEVMSTKQRVTCPPNSQGWFPLICAAKDGRFRLGAIDKDNNLGKSLASWEIPGSAANASLGFNVIYKPCFIFTDLAVPPAVWDCRQKSSSVISLDHVFNSTNFEQITNGGANRRMGLSILALADNWDAVQIAALDVITGLVSQQFWRLLPGESLRWSGESTPTNQFHAKTTIIGDSLMIIVQT